MNWPYLLLALASIALGAVGQLFLKLATTKSDGDLVNFYIGLFKTPYSYLGALSYGLSFVLWMFLLKRFELSFIRPLMSIGYIFTTVLAIVFLNEKVAVTRWIGTVLIVAGIFFMVMSLEK